MELQYNTKEHNQTNTVHLVIHKRGRPRHLDFASSIPNSSSKFCTQASTAKSQKPNTEKLIVQLN